MQFHSLPRKIHRKDLPIAHRWSGQYKEFHFYLFFRKMARIHIINHIRPPGVRNTHTHTHPMLTQRPRDTAVFILQWACENCQVWHLLYKFHFVYTCGCGLQGHSRRLGSPQYKSKPKVTNSSTYFNLRERFFMNNSGIDNKEDTFICGEHSILCGKNAGACVVFNFGWIFDQLTVTHSGVRACSSSSSNALFCMTEATRGQFSL